MCALAAALVSTGCATTAQEPEVTANDLTSIEERLRDVERTNGRLMVRVEEAERQIARVRDRAESNRIALQRHGHLNQQRMATTTAPRDDGQADQRPAPAPESNYHYRGEQGAHNYQADPTLDQRMQRRGGTRIPLSQHQSGTAHSQRSEPHHDSQQRSSSQPRASGVEQQQEIVITNEDLERRFGTTPSGSTTTSSSSSSSSRTSSSSQSSGGGRQAQPSVTSERLPTTEELKSSSEPEEAPAEEEGSRDSSANEYANASHSELMELYQDSLAQYRAGDYATALRGFSAFLEAGPRQDYVDNALYWIGECHYGLGDYTSSVRHFQRIIDEVPNGNKVPDAMLKMSLAYKRMGQPDRAVGLIEELIENYPNTNPARLGEERLEDFAQ